MNNSEKVICELWKNSMWIEAVELYNMSMEYAVIKLKKTAVYPDNFISGKKRYKREKPINAE